MRTLFVVIFTVCKNMHFAEHFSFKELTHTNTGIDNLPTSRQKSTLAALSHILEDIRAVVGKPLYINSAFRSPQVNHAVGGSRTSFHCTVVLPIFQHVTLHPMKSKHSSVLSSPRIHERLSSTIPSSTLLMTSHDSATRARYAPGMKKCPSLSKLLGITPQQCSLIFNSKPGTYDKYLVDYY